MWVNEWRSEWIDYFLKWSVFLRGCGGASQAALVVKNPPANAGDWRDVDLIPGLGRSPGGGNGNSLQYSCLKSSMVRGSWQAAIYGVTASEKTEHTCMQCYHLIIRKSLYLVYSHSDSLVLTPSTFSWKSRKQWTIHRSRGTSQLSQRAASAQWWGHFGAKGRAYSRREANSNVRPLQPGYQVGHLILTFSWEGLVPVLIFF